MKKLTKFFMVAMLAGMCSLGYAQAQSDYMNDPKPFEKVLGVITIQDTRHSNMNKGWGTLPQWYLGLLEYARTQYPNKNVDIRNMTTGRCCSSGDSNYYGGNDPIRTAYSGPANAKVIEILRPEDYVKDNLSKAFNKAFRNVREGSRIAIDQVTVTNLMDRNALKDQVIDYLLDNGYKVIAKEYLEKLYEEQQNQQSGIYNEKTILQDNNFSAVGYYINVKVTESSLRVQVVNVSTGEYEGNATINF